MLTCEQILTEARRIAAGSQITKETYCAIAEAIHQPAKAPLLGDLPDDEQRQLNAMPEATELRKAYRLRTDDWSDMVQATVTRWQLNAALQRWLDSRNG